MQSCLNLVQQSSIIVTKITSGDIRKNTREKCQKGYFRREKIDYHSQFFSNSNLKFTQINIGWSSFNLVLSESAKKKLMMVTKQQKRGTSNVTLSQVLEGKSCLTKCQLLWFIFSNQINQSSLIFFEISLLKTNLIKYFDIPK